MLLSPYCGILLLIWGEEYMQINRLFEIVYLLMDKRSMKATELATHFEVSKRTILRDIEVLTMAGIPIYTTTGRNGGISILNKFKLSKTVISEDEQKQILYALQGVGATGCIEADNILSRLRSLFEKTDKDWIEVDFSRWSGDKTDKTKFDMLKNAIIGEHVISFTYSGSSGCIAGRKVYPLKLVFRTKSWYLQTFCLLKNDYRTFKISRMSSVKMLEDSFSSEKFQLPKIDFEHNSKNLVNVKLYFAPDVAYRAYDEFDEQDIVKNEDGSLIASMRMPNDYWLYKYIYSFGLAAEVLEPQNIRDEIIRQADVIKNKYLNN